MESLARIVERYIAAEMLERLGLILDGWSHASEHFVAVFACYEGKRKLFLLRRRLKQLDVNKQNAEDVDDVKARKSVAEESIKDAQEELKEQCEAEVAVRKAADTEAENLRAQAQQDVQAKEEAEKVNALRTRDFQHLLEKHETGKERDKK
ncbi:hypothetical protein GQ600_20211 [Phytophthora cactorum]|nr:hypothetical protein GQ600_20211 [Phytophthora cactorum]